MNLKVIDDQIHLVLENNESKHLVMQLKKVGVKYIDFKKAVENGDLTNIDVDDNAVGKQFLINKVNNLKRKGVL
jgi:hypothetical protein